MNRDADDWQQQKTVTRKQAVITATTTEIAREPPHSRCGSTLVLQFPWCSDISMDSQVALVGVPYDYGVIIPGLRSGTSRGLTLFGTAGLTITSALRPAKGAGLVRH